MLLFYILAGLSGFAIIATLIISYICYRMAFYAFKNPADDQEYPIPEGKAYEPYRDKMINKITGTARMNQPIWIWERFNRL